MINSFKEAVLNIDYSWRDPKTYAILIPGLSSLIHIIQAKHLEPKLILNEHGMTILPQLSQDPSFIDTLDFSNDEKYAKGRKYQLLACTIRFIALAILICLAEPLVSKISLLALAIMWSISGIADVLAMVSYRTGALCRIRKQDLPTEVCFDINGPTTPSFFLQDFLLANLHNNSFPATSVRLNNIGRLSVA